jgi:sulfide dehydrogenase cytochrome subunit
MRHSRAAAFAAGLLGLGFISQSALAQDARYLAGSCANCHGTDGRSSGSGGMPGLAGLSRPYFIEQMNAFRSGARQASVMHQIVKGYTDDQVSRLADHYAAAEVRQIGGSAMNTSFGNRRRALQWLGSAGASGVLGACAMSSPSSDLPAKKLGRVLVVGAGFGGATAAKYLKCGAVPASRWC